VVELLSQEELEASKQAPLMVPMDLPDLLQLQVASSVADPVVAVVVAKVLDQ
jgi:hypothetical protein